MNYPRVKLLWITNSPSPYLDKIIISPNYIWLCLRSASPSFGFTFLSPSLPLFLSLQMFPMLSPLFISVSFFLSNPHRLPHPPSLYSPSHSPSRFLHHHSLIASCIFIHSISPYRVLISYLTPLLPSLFLPFNYCLHLSIPFPLSIPLRLHLSIVHGPSKSPPHFDTKIHTWAGVLGCGMYLNR